MRELMAESDLVKRLVWSGLLAGHRRARQHRDAAARAMIWVRAFGEEPPE